MSDVQRFSSGSPYEVAAGFSRAIRIGERIIFSLTAPVVPEGTESPKGTSSQMRRCLEIIAEVLREAGGSLQDVIRTEIHYTAQADIDVIDRLHVEYFGTVSPVTKMLPVIELADPEWLLEIEVEAMLR